MIRIEHLTKRFGRMTAVDDLSLEVPSGQSVALWGPNGAGKSTIIRCVLGLLPCRGRITIDGLDARRDGKAARRLIGYVPQELGFYDDLRLGEAIRYFGRLKGLRIADIDAVLAGVGLCGHQGKRIRELSGGMKQRLALAIALLGDPPVLILDEVTASLDACGRDEFVALLSRLAGAGRSMLFASHRVEEIHALASRVILLEKGRIAGESTAEAFAQRQAGGVLHLRVSAAVTARAISLLRGSGFNARRNGVGLLVSVPPTARATPFRILAEAQLPVENFEILTEQQAAAQESQS